MLNDSAWFVVRPDPRLVGEFCLERSGPFPYVQFTGCGKGLDFPREVSKNVPRGLKPIDFIGSSGTAEAVPFQSKSNDPRAEHAQTDRSE